MTNYTINIVFIHLGYVLSVMGRRRNLPNINFVDWAARMQAERQAVNFVIQGRTTDNFSTDSNSSDCYQTIMFCCFKYVCKG